MEHVQLTIDDALSAIRSLLATERYRRIFYSAANASCALGTGIFNVGDDVKHYIVAGLRALDQSAAKSRF